jgi:malonate-semialdehyde dehydrogenase (acetylating)/methylmalonate-semialdehyde dehydrogenase
MTQPETLPNIIRGTRRAPPDGESLEVRNPATDEVLARVRLSDSGEVDAAVAAARAAFDGWSRVPAADRIQPLFRLKVLLEEELEPLARSITLENGKTLGEARGELRRAIENVEVACGAPSLMQGRFSESIAEGIDEYSIQQPVGVSAIICPFNFPGMIPFWFLPYAVACGNTVIVKPSERCPMTMVMLADLFERAGFPPGVINIVHGAARTVDALLDHPGVATVSFVGSTPVARHVYARAAASGKRVQAQGGAKNPMLVLPDADPEMTTRIVADSAFGNAGQRCLAGSLAVTVGEADGWFRRAIADAASSRTVGSGLDPAVEMGPVITEGSRVRIEGLIESGLGQGGAAVVDGRGAHIRGFERGYFLRPTVVADVRPGTTLATTEVFGPVLGLMNAASLDEAIAWINGGTYGNMACLFTRDGEAARTFRSRVQAGNIGVNLGVAAPMAFFPFSGWKESFFGTLHGQGRDAVAFFTQTKVVIERWPQGWSRTF